jgi:hypothetical protein
MSTLDTFELSPHLVWTDEFDYTSVDQEVSYASEGALIIQEGVKQAGRPITLEGQISRADLLALRAMSETRTQHTLTFNGEAFEVRWRYKDKPYSATPLVDYANPGDDDFYSVTLRFIEV